MRSRHTVFAAKGEALAGLFALPLAGIGDAPLLSGGDVGLNARTEVGEGCGCLGGGQAEGALHAVNLGLELRGGLCCARQPCVGCVGEQHPGLLCASL